MNIDITPTSPPSMAVLVNGHVMAISPHHDERGVPRYDLVDIDADRLEVTIAWRPYMTVLPPELQENQAELLIPNECSMITAAQIRRP